MPLGHFEKHHLVVFYRHFSGLFPPLLFALLPDPSKICLHFWQNRVGYAFFSKERNILPFFCVLLKRTLCSLRSFTNSALWGNNSEKCLATVPFCRAVIGWTFLRLRSSANGDRGRRGEGSNSHYSTRKMPLFLQLPVVQAGLSGL